MCFALETVIDEVAEALDIDPIEIRRRNLVAEGGAAWSTARRGRRTARVEVLDALEASPVWRDRSDG